MLFVIIMHLEVIHNDDEHDDNFHDGDDDGSCRLQWIVHPSLPVTSELESNWDRRGRLGIEWTTPAGHPLCLQKLYHGDTGGQLGILLTLACKAT